MLTHPDVGIQAVFNQLETQNERLLIALSQMGAELTVERAKNAQLTEALAAAAQFQADVLAKNNVVPITGEANG